MAPERPASVLVIGILNIIFGAWGLIAYIMTGVSIAMMVAMNNTPPSVFNPTAGMLDYLEKEVPGFMAILIGSSIGATVLMILLVLSGVGLVRMRGWGRGLAIGVAAFHVLWQIAGAAVAILVTNPAMAKWSKHSLEEMQKQNPTLAPQLSMQMELQSNSGLNNISPIVLALVTVCYATVILVVLLRPRVARAFAEFAAFRREHGRDPGSAPEDEAASQA